MCDVCKMYECPSLCPNAEEEKNKAESCEYCLKSIRSYEEAYALPDESYYHKNCLFEAMDFLEYFELAAFFGKDENIDEEEFIQWYDALSEEEIAEELGANEF